VKGSYKPYEGDDYSALVGRVNGDGDPGASPSGDLQGMVERWIEGSVPASEVLMLAHREGVTTESLDRLIRQSEGDVDFSIADFDDGESPVTERGRELMPAQEAGEETAPAVAAPDEGEMGDYLGFLREEGLDQERIGEEMERKFPGQSEAYSPLLPAAGDGMADIDDGAEEEAGGETDDLAEQKLDNLEEAKEATAELTEQAVEQAVEEGDPEAAKSALEKGKEALAGKAKTTGKLAAGMAGAVAGNFLRNVESHTGGKKDLSIQGSRAPAGQGSQPPGNAAQEKAADTGGFDAALAKNKQEQEAQEGGKRPTTNLGNWG